MLISTKIDNSRTHSFYGLRVIAILCVIVLHSGKAIGEIGCPISMFFVLSGFLFRYPNNIRQYYTYKLLKVFPIYWLTFLIDFYINHRSLTWGMLAHVFLLQTYVPCHEYADIRPFFYQYLGVSWFLSCLLFCYLVSPWIYNLINKLRNKVDVLIILGLLIIGMAIYMQLPIPQAFQKWAWYVSPYYRFAEYLCGMLLARLLTNFVFPTRIDCCSKIVVVSIFAYYILQLVYKTNLWVWPNLFIITVLYVYNIPMCNRILGNKFMKVCATNIMPVYLLHESVMPTIRELGGGWIDCTIASLFISSVYALIIYLIDKYVLVFLFKNYK